MRNFSVLRNLVLLAFPVAGILASCTGKGKASLDIEMNGAPDSTEIIVSRLAVNRVEILDTLYTRKGKAGMSVDVMPGSPEFMYLATGDRSSISLLLQAGEKVRVSYDPEHPGQVSVKGSAESELMQEVDRASREFNMKFDSLMSMYGEAGKTVSTGIGRELGRLYVRRKQDASRYILSHPGSMTSVHVLYQEAPNGKRIFSELTDVMLMEQVYDSLRLKYPSSPYLAALADDISARRNAIEMGNILSSAEEVDYPEISLQDIDGVQRSLSSLRGKVTVLVFWDDASVEQRAFNVGLKELYRSYRDRGMEIYQVSMNQDKTKWAMQVKQQELPWISVCDPSGTSALVYNVKALPAMYVISRDGVITARDMFNVDMLRLEISRLL